MTDFTTPYGCAPNTATYAACSGLANSYLCGFREEAALDSGMMPPTKRKHVTMSLLWDEYMHAAQRAIVTPGPASCTEAGKASSPSRCVRPTWAATSSLSATPATQYRWSSTE